MNPVPDSANIGSLVLMALGSNLGDSPALIRVAMDRLESLLSVPVARSSLWSSTPVDCPPGSPRFVNAAVVFPRPSRYTAESWLKTTQALEQAFGRTPKTILNEARRLDLDLIAWGAEIRETPALTLPHPRVHQRRFVLQPLAELVPDLRLPGQRKTIRQLLANCPADPTFAILQEPSGPGGRP